MAADAPDDLHALDVLPPGTRFGELEILRTLGVGGFGIVYLAHYLLTGRPPPPSTARAVADQRATRTKDRTVSAARRGLAALLMVALLPIAGAQESQEPQESQALQAAAALPCLIVYGHARNSGDAAENAAWDRLNARFNEQVTRRLQASGQAAESLLFRAGVTDVAESVAGLIERARQRGCPRVVDTAVFADGAAQTLVVRLRVHPLLGRAGPRLVPRAAWQIGEPLYSTQRDLDLSQRSLDRINLAALAEQMVDGYLADK